MDLISTLDPGPPIETRFATSKTSSESRPCLKPELLFRNRSGSGSSMILTLNRSICNPKFSEGISYFGYNLSRYHFILKSNLVVPVLGTLARQIRAKGSRSGHVMKAWLVWSKLSGVFLWETFAETIFHFSILHGYVLLFSLCPIVASSLLYSEVVILMFVLNVAFRGKSPKSSCLLCGYCLFGSYAFSLKNHHSILHQTQLSKFNLSRHLVVSL